MKTLIKSVSIFAILTAGALLFLSSGVYAAPFVPPRPQPPRDEVVFCRDTDGGENFLQAGTVTVVIRRNGRVFIKTLHDESPNARILLERTCGNATFTVRHDCSVDGMVSQNGACVRQNRAPVLGRIGNRAVNENSELLFQITAEDPDGDQLTYSALRLPPGATFVSSTFRWTPTFDQAGNYNVIFSVSDGRLTDSEKIRITVHNVNRAPIIHPIENQEINTGELLQFEITAEDPDGDNLIYSAQALPASATFENRVFSWTPNDEQASVYEIIFDVTDGNLNAQTTVVITVHDINRPPVFLPLGNQEINEDQDLRFEVQATDPDGDNPLYFVVGLPPGASFDSNTRVFTWHPSYEQAGVYNVTFVAVDEQFQTRLHVTITVRNVNRAPILNPIGNRWISVDEEMNIQIVAEDPDNDALNFAADNLPHGAELVGNIFQWTPEQEGEFPIQFNVSDGLETVSEIVNITVSFERWLSTSLEGAPTARANHSAVWTGTEMIVWGGLDLAGNSLATGGRYNPETDSWNSVSLINAPSPRAYHSAIWTGNEMIIWGGAGVDSSGARYNPQTDTWRSISQINAPSGRWWHTAVWTGTEMIVWGGYDGNGPEGTLHNDGARYDPVTDLWSPITLENAPQARRLHQAVWTGTEMIIWGGTIKRQNGEPPTNTGGRYNLVTNSWTEVSTNQAPVPREGYFSMIWTGLEMIAGGSDRNNQGGRYNPVTDSWRLMSIINAPVASELYAFHWTGTEIILWGGYSRDQMPQIGGRYNPTTDLWKTTTNINPPQGRSQFSSVWTGKEMIVWGGDNHLGQNRYLNSGGRYRP